MSTLIGYMSIGALAYGGIETDEWWVVIFNKWAKQPTFHRFMSSPSKREDDPTACGRATWRNGTTIGISLQTVHANSFARPCRKCWPEWEDPSIEVPA